MPDNIFGVLAALMSVNDVVPGTSTTSVGGPPMAGLGGATNNFAAAQAGAPDPEVPMIYQGSQTYQTAPDTPRGFGSGTTKVKADKAEHFETLMEKFTKAPAEEQRRMALLLSMAGYMGSGSLETAVERARDVTLGQTIEAYKALLTDAAVQYTRNGVKVTPEQMLKQMISYRLPSGTEWDGDLNTIGGVTKQLGINDGGLLDKKDKPFTGTKTFTSTSIARDIMDPADAKALTRAMLQRELGRDPTEDEFEDFIGAVQHAQRVNPSKTVSTQSTDYKKGEAVSQSVTSTTHEGIGSEGIADIALQKARQNPNWAEWQAVGTYAPALFEALGATVAGR